MELIRNSRNSTAGCTVLSLGKKVLRCPVPPHCHPRYRPSSLREARCHFSRVASVHGKLPGPMEPPEGRPAPRRPTWGPCSVMPGVISFHHVSDRGSQRWLFQSCRRARVGQESPRGEDCVAFRWPPKWGRSALGKVPG